MTLFNRSSREPDSWSAAVRRNFSVFVAAGRISSDGSFAGVGGSAGMTIADWGAAGAAGGSRVTVGANDVDADDTSEGAIVAGGVKKEPSSSVSRKSL